MEAMQPQEEPGCVASVRDALTGVRPEGYAGGSFKVNDLREVAKRRDSGLKGSTVPALMAKLGQWVVDKRLPELAQCRVELRVRAGGVSKKESSR